ncbi:MAG: MFS transporter [Burkholderiaceae bacterium]|nr:MFS transporter [Burkholderiaceae bacterium]
MPTSPSQPASRFARYLSASPLREPRFRVFYAGSVGTALGYTMQAAMAAWVMATLTPSALMVAMVQSASTVPFLLFGLIAGSLADIMDRRRVIIATQLVMLSATGALAVIEMTGLVGPSLVLLLTFACGAGFTFYLPAQQASVNDLVAREDLPQAIALGAVAFNVARAVGPAVAGAVAAWTGSGSALLMSSLFFVPMMFGVRSVRVTERSLPGVPEKLWAGVQSGVRYARHSPAMRSLVVLNLTFTLCASALWALLPVIARDQLGLGPGGYGLLFGTFGAGAVVSAVTIPGQLKRRGLQKVVRASIILWIVATLVVAATGFAVVALAGAFLAGGAWVGVLSSLAAGTQSTAPAWVRARAVSINLLAMQTGLAVGSVIWGMLASALEVRAATALSAALMLLLQLLSQRVRVQLGSEADVTPFARLPELVVSAEPRPNDGPVLVQVEYRIDPDKRAAFLQAIQAVEATRRRNGATSWRVFRDIEESDRFIERYVIASWAEYVRLRMRMTVADRMLQNRVVELQRKDVPTRISRYIGIDPHERAREAAAGSPPGTAAGSPPGAATGSAPGEAR